MITILNFIYNDPRFKGATSMSKKARTATDIMLEFIAHKLLDFLALILVLAVIYLMFVVFYSNMVLYANIAWRESGLYQFVHYLLALVCAAIFFLFALFLLLSGISYVLSLFIPQNQTIPGADKLKATTEKIKKLKIYTYVQNFGANIKNIFQWAPDKKARLRKRLLILLSIIAFYNSWFKFSALNAKTLHYHFMPDFMMDTAESLFKATRPYANSVYGFIAKYVSLAYQFIDQNVFDRISNLF